MEARATTRLSGLGQSRGHGEELRAWEVAMG